MDEEPRGPVPLRPIALENDLPSVGDDLQVSREAKAFARRIASRTLEPPFSLAIFGERGSGLAFFTHQLSVCIAELSAAAASDPEIDARHPILQVYYNARRNADTNLWASLANQVFDALGQFLSGPDSVRGEKTEFDALLATLGTSQQMLDSEKIELERARAELAQASAARQEVGEARRRGVAELSELKAWRPESELAKELQEAADRSPLADAVGPVTDGAAALRDLTATVDRSRTFFGAITQISWSRKERHFAILCVVAALVWPLANYFLLGLGYGGSVPILLAPLAGLGFLALRRVLQFRHAIDTAHAWVQERKFNLERARVRREAIAQAELEACEKNEEAARRRLEEAERAMRDAEGTAARSTRDKLRQFLERSSNAGYETSVVRSVRSDFEVLSELMLESSERNAGSELRVRRVVLYIENLDLCEPERIAETIEAIDLMLSLPLFVVVAAMDPAVVARALSLARAEELNDSRVRLERTFKLVFWPQRFDAAAVHAVLEQELGGPPLSSEFLAGVASCLRGLPQGPFRLVNQFRVILQLRNESSISPAIERKVVLFLLCALYSGESLSQTVLRLLGPNASPSPRDLSALNAIVDNQLDEADSEQWNLLVNLLQQIIASEDTTESFEIARELAPTVARFAFDRMEI